MSNYEGTLRLQDYFSMRFNSCHIWTNETETSETNASNDMKEKVTSSRRFHFAILTQSEENSNLKN